MASLNPPTSSVSSAGLTNGTARPQNSVAKPIVRKRIEPVIPLPYIQRRPKHPTTTTQLPSPLRTNSESSSSTPKKDDSEQSQPDQEAPLINGNKSSEQVATYSLKPRHEDPRVTTTHADHLPRQDPELAVGAAAPQKQEAAVQRLTAGELTPPENTPGPPSTVSFPPSALSPPPFNNMRPPFHPVNNHPAHFRGPMPDPIRLPAHPLNQPRMHQHHPSNGSLVFGGFHGSNASSPAPLSAGAFPPPMPMPHEQIPGTSVNAFGRPVLSTTPVDGHVLATMNHGPLTPHSFHGSQSSRNGEDFVGRPLANGHNNADLGRPGLPPATGRGPFPPNNQPPFSPAGFEVDEAMGFTEYISQMFARPDFADCEVVLVIPDHLTTTNSQYPGTPNGPLRLPAHRLILSHHPVLRNMIQEQAQQADGSREVRIVSDDPYLRADAMWRAIKYLYGHRYVPLPRNMEKESDLERFHFALGCAAAGAHLDVPPVSINGIREASKLVSWDAVEKGLDFALTGSVLNFDHLMDVQHTFPQFRYKYGPYVGELVEKIMMFLIMQFPTNFTLDTTVEEPRYTRLPALPAVSRDTSGSGIANHNLPGQAPSRLSSINIKFGDMDLSEGNGRVKSPPTHPSVGYNAGLSRILLNLPFEMLKFLLESNGLGSVPGWQTVQDRQRVMSDVIAEREARRLRFVGELAAGRYQGHVPSDGLQSNKPQLLEGSWNSVCWREECLPTTDVPMIGRTWIPLGGAS